LRRLVSLVLLMTAVVFGQEGASVNIYSGPPVVPLQTFLFYSGSNLQYVCYAKSLSPNSFFTIASATAASPAVFTFTAHGFYVANAITTPRVTVTGATGSWVSLNTDWLLTPVSANTFTLANPVTGTNLNSTGFGALTGTVVLNTTAPRTSQNYWSILKLTYDGSSNLTGKFWAFGDAGTRGVFANKCDDRAAAYIEWK